MKAHSYCTFQCSKLLRRKSTIIASLTNKIWLVTVPESILHYNHIQFFGGWERAIE